ncbi:UNVERIFIED_CONTAM: hypothetical protein Sradi_4944300 [Sesamum radiatum]|uniref:Uncharacterized protein n=1 Tax=Sesamum radiatum TaxID=300843 RepID=A0AAW2MHH1_SESRA
MASRAATSTALLLLLNLLFFTMVSSTSVPCPTPNPPSHPTATSPQGQVPKDTLKLGVCANLLNDLVHSWWEPHPRPHAARSLKGWPILRLPYASAQPSKPMSWALTSMFQSPSACFSTTVARKPPLASSVHKPTNFNYALYSIK